MIEQLKAALAPFALTMDEGLGDDAYVHEPPFTAGQYRKAREAYEMLSKYSPPLAVGNKMRHVDMSMPRDEPMKVIDLWVQGPHSKETIWHGYDAHDASSPQAKLFKIYADMVAQAYNKEHDA